MTSKKQKGRASNAARNIGEIVCMGQNNSATPSASSGKRDPGFAPIRRGLLEHWLALSVNARALYIWLHLKAYWSGPKRGCVEVSFDDMARGNGWSYSMVRRTIEELTRKGYIQVARAANQYQFTTIRILRFDVEQSDSAVSTYEHTKLADNSAVSSGALSAVSTGERSSEHSKPINVQSYQDLHTPKKAKKVKEEKKGDRDAVRRPIDAELRISSKGFSPQKRKQNLESRLIEKGLKDESFFDDNLDKLQRAAFAATGYTLRDPRKLANGFVSAVEVTWDKCKGTEISQGNLCSKIIDYCLAQQESCKKLGAPVSDYYWPPDFQDHRDRLRAQERAREKSSSERRSA